MLCLHQAVRSETSEICPEICSIHQNYDKSPHTAGDAECHYRPLAFTDLQLVHPNCMTRC